jgi:NAD(P)-dependent dehydrogenase (short-subunit alcohol dehydrogenase family)
MLNTICSRGDNMSGTHTIVMTGASRGIGRHAAARILDKDPNAHLVIIARDDFQVRDEFSTGGRRITLVTADLSSVASTHAAAVHISSLLRSGTLPALQGFVGNAGVMLADNETATAEGLDPTFAVNVLANHILVKGLEDHFVSPARVTLTVSDAHFGDFAHNLGILPGPAWSAPALLAGPRAFPSPGSTAAGLAAYSTSKLAAIYLVHEWARRLAPRVHVLSFNPAFVPGTGLSRNANRVAGFLMSRVAPLLAVTPIASTQEASGGYLADVALGTVAAPTGSYVNRRRAARSSDESYDTARETELWDALEDITHTLISRA